MVGSAAKQGMTNGALPPFSTVTRNRRPDF
jgi:hypothetical protein